MKEPTKKIVHCVILFSLALLQIYLNYLYYRFAYQIAIIYTITIVCAIMQLFAKARKNTIYLYIFVFIVVAIGLFNAPQYTVHSAKEMILKESRDISSISFYGCMTSVSKSKANFQYKCYHFETDNKTDRMIIFDINTGQFVFQEKSVFQE